MKWFKHSSTTIKDEKIQLLMDEFGIGAYTIFFALQELCAEKIDKESDPEIVISWPYLERLVHAKRSTIRPVIDRCASLELLAADVDDKQLICKIPNLLENMDEWTRKLRSNSGGTPDKNRLDKKKIRLDKRKTAPPAIIPNDQDFFQSLKQIPAYKHLDLEKELSKIDAWILAHTGRQKTKKFVINWLNKAADQILEVGQGSQERKYTPQQVQSALSLKKLKDSQPGGQHALGNP